MITITGLLFFTPVELMLNYDLDERSPFFTNKVFVYAAESKRKHRSDANTKSHCIYV